MERIAKFEKVSWEQFLKDLLEKTSFTEEEIKNIYDHITLPKRATKHSAGYDFYAPYSFKLEAGKSTLIPTGIRAKIREDYVLMLYPRSSLGFKYRLQLNNTVGVIDADYYNANNEGHIFAKIINDSREDKMVDISSSEAFLQGIFTPFGITEDDDVDTERIGGVGSTTKRVK